MLFQAVLLVWAVSGHEGLSDRRCRKMMDSKKCVKRGCEWDGETCTAGEMPPPMEREDPEDEPKETKWPWNGTQSPDYWENCVQVWCDKYSWYGGKKMCHWEPKYGCGCEAMQEKECIEDDECEFIGTKEVGCREKVRCKELNGGECKKNLDKCALCDKGCVDKCKVGPGQSNLPMLSLQLTDACECKIAAFF